MSLTLMSLHGGILIGVILLLRTLCKNRMPRTMFLILWGVALLRLLIPFFIPSQFSVYSLIGQQTAWESFGTDTGLLSTGVHIDTVIDNGWVKFAVNRLIPCLEEIPVHPLCNDMDAEIVITIIRWGGSIFCALLFFLLYHICVRRFRCSLPVQNKFVLRWVSGHRLRRPVSARQSDRVTTPLTYGILKPVILLPRELEGLEDEKMEYILQHEYRHICRFDGIWKFLMIPTVCLHWFNPMVWIMYFVLSRDIELACDESVLRHFGTAARKSYARVLLEMSEEMKLYKPLYNAFGRNATEERIRAIMLYKKKTFVTIVAAVIMVMMVACGFATSEQPDQPDRDSVYISGINENDPTNAASEEQSAEILPQDDNDETGEPSYTTNTLGSVDESDKDVNHADKTDLTDAESDDITEWIPIINDNAQEESASDTIISPQSIIIYIQGTSEDNSSVLKIWTGTEESEETE